MGRIWESGYDKGPFPAGRVEVDTSAFTGNLSILDDTVQKALETIDAIEVGTGYVPYTGATQNVDLGVYDLLVNRIDIGGAGEFGNYKNLRIHSSSEVYSGLRLTNSVTGVGMNKGFEFSTYNSDGIINLYEDADIKFYTNNVLRMTLSSDGDLTVTGTGTFNHIVETTPTLYKLDQTTPQDIVPYAGTTFSLGYHDIAPTAAPGVFVFPQLRFENTSPLPEINSEWGAIRGGFFVTQTAGGAAPVLGLSEDFETGEIGFMTWDSSLGSLGGIAFLLNLDSSKFFIHNVDLDGSYAPCIGGADSDGNNALFIDTSFVLWDSEDAGGVTIYGASQDLTSVSLILQWISTTETLQYVGAGGFEVYTAGTGGDTQTVLKVAYKAIGDGSDNDGVRLAFEHRTDLGLLGSPYTAGYIDCIQTDATETTETAYLSFGGVTSAVSAEWLRLNGTTADFKTLALTTRGSYSATYFGGATAFLDSGSNYGTVGTSNSYPFYIRVNNGVVADFDSSSLEMYDFTFSSGSIISSTGAISFGDENISTSGTGSFGFDTTIGDGTHYLAVEELDIGAGGTYAMLAGYSDGAFTNVFAVKQNLIIYDAANDGAPSLTFVNNGVTQIGQLIFVQATDTFYFSNGSGVGDADLNLYVSKGLGVGEATTNASTIRIGGSTQATLVLNGSTNGRISGLVGSSEKWQVDFLSTTLNFYNTTLADTVLQLQEDGDAKLYNDLFMPNGSLGIGYDGTSALVAGLQMNHIDGILSMGTLGSGYAGFKDAVTAMQWNPYSASFRVGRCSNGTAWDTLGNYSFASGLDNTASGTSSTSMGQGNLVSGNFGVGIGFGNEVSVAYGYAFGNGCTAQLSQNAMALGKSCTASGGSSIAMGDSCVASAGNTMALGNTATASHTRSMVLSAGTANASSDTTNQMKLSSQYVDIVPITYARIGDLTNYIRISPTGDLTFQGSSGLYPRTLNQSTEPASGTGSTQLDTGEMCIWTDSDDSKCYLCYNHGGTVKTVELT